MKYTTVLLLLLSVFASSCKEDTVTVYVHDQGTYQGKVVQYAVDGSIPAKQAGATVSIVGTSLSAVTDASGNFTIYKVPAAKLYQFVVTKPGFDTAHSSNDQFDGSGTAFLDDQSIQAIPYDSIHIITATTFLDTLRMYMNGRWVDTSGYGLKLAISVYGHDSLTLTQALFTVSKDVNSGDTIMVEAGEVSILRDGFGTATILIHANALRRTNGVQLGDKLNVFLRAKSNTPVARYWYVVSPYLTSRKVVVQ